MNDQIFFFIKYDIRNMEEIANNKKKMKFLVRLKNVLVFNYFQRNTFYYSLYYSIKECFLV